MAGLEKRVREYLSDWKPWIIICYAGLAALVVFLFSVSSSSSKSQVKIAKDEAIHQAEIESNSRAAVISCLNAIPTLINANKLVIGVRTFHIALVENAKRVLDATPKSDPQYKIRKQNYEKAASTIPLVSGLHFVIPTKKQCRDRGKQILDKDRNVGQ